MKYIPAEKLIAEIKRRIDSWSIRGKNSPVGQGKDTCESRVTELSDLLSFITSLQQDKDGDTAIGNIIPLRSVLESAIKYLSEPSLPSNLDEAAFTYENELWESGYKNCGYSPQEVNDAFKAGAEWMAGQGVTREVEVKEDAGGYPYIDKHFELYDYDKDEPLFKAGGKVVVQIRKK